MEKENIPDYETILAATRGEKWAVEKALECYSGELDKLATVKRRQTDGSVKKVIDEDMRQLLALKLIEAIPQFSLEKE